MPQVPEEAENKQEAGGKVEMMGLHEYDLPFSHARQSWGRVDSKWKLWDTIVI